MIPGTEAPKIKAIELAAEKYVDVRDKRMALTEKECQAKQALIETVITHQDKLSVNADGERLYRFDDLVVILKPGHANVKVRHATDDTDKDED